MMQRGLIFLCLVLAVVFNGLRDLVIIEIFASNILGRRDQIINDITVSILIDIILLIESKYCHICTCYVSK
jgi:hypothetical protein